MKPLTIEELKALEVGDWVWLKDIEQNEDNYAIIINSKEKFGFLTINRHFAFDYEAYGKTWLAYKNKEQAEKYVLQRANEPNGLYSIYERVEQLDLVYTCVSKQEVERRLAELKGEPINE